MKPIKLLLISRDPDQAERLTSQLMAQKKYEIYYEKNATAILARLKSTPIEILVMNIDYFGPNQLILVDQMRELKKHLKILVIGERINQSTSATAEKIPEMVILKKYFFNLDKDFAGVLARILSEEKIAKRVSKRHPTQQQALIKVARTGKMFQGLVCNLSTSGAYVEYEKGQLHISDKLQIIISLGELKKTHIIKM